MDNHSLDDTCIRLRSLRWRAAHRWIRPPQVSALTPHPRTDYITISPYSHPRYMYNRQNRIHNIKPSDYAVPVSSARSSPTKQIPLGKGGLDPDSLHT